MTTMVGEWSRLGERKPSEGTWLVMVVVVALLVVKSP